MEFIDSKMIQILRSKTPRERLSMTHQMWRVVRKRIFHSLRDDHPEWTSEQLADETALRMMGVEAANVIS